MEERREGAVERAGQMALFVAAERRARLALRQGHLEKVLTAQQLKAVVRHMIQTWLDGFTTGRNQRSGGDED
ncbi:hypothetical protein BLA24_07390 [Streptomyces cinnamoneus]|uniref:Uncharacterized protein n=1 Tax=Streptomyces cinnamoneus TaxID=53446 RepID=A0A2G1XMV0_STRCJ|nr:hypothetical protein [Streptomyces cinnamoneus]PHQ52584.1 hypothetical protein BLA24_07390 [Streptomyces cinnamoneus]PPT16122.1 hypothetical protein CYQ11_27545 [Streptomyces cinnamoneus]